MKLIGLILATTVSLPFAANAKLPSQIDVVCQRGDAPAKFVSLRDCDSKIDRLGYGPYWCSGPIDDTYSAKAIGYGGSSGLEIRISHNNAKFSGGSPIYMNGESVTCISLAEYNSRERR
jgi:hypothetical protein